MYSAMPIINGTSRASFFWIGDRIRFNVLILEPGGGGVL